MNLSFSFQLVFVGMGMVLTVHRMGIDRIPSEPRRPASFQNPQNLKAKWNSALTPLSLACSPVEKSTSGSTKKMLSRLLLRTR